eukprot:CAMPEP_0181215876 /NCGR_PEP_ID=MMETSP1096-20121128/26261_1 /TAXON_ID=156174 ORGANISM="Chrysochromulina ericina, Strain CCMP281" /NCGR_SAMPLE_ID=MMETSP1096 /ASSEMBLY_ACC=CAM_ASM_000453 /LENGTH=171 /DNA_ID=CAMNT_0023307789 /DNA_START=12 /DNA_END=527 /DNA_ORIENTATION=-
MSETAQLDPELEAPNPEQSRTSCACAFSLTCGCFYCVQGYGRHNVCVALTGIALADIALAGIALGGASFPYPLPGRCPPSAPPPSRRVATLTIGGSALCVAAATVYMSCIHAPAFTIALPAPAIAWACTAARQCCRMNGRSKRGRAPGCAVLACASPCCAPRLNGMSKKNV